jgi:hypothetical protein
MMLAPVDGLWLVASFIFTDGRCLLLECTWKQRYKLKTFVSLIIYGVRPDHET